MSHQAKWPAVLVLALTASFSASHVSAQSTFLIDALDTDENGGLPVPDDRYVVDVMMQVAPDDAWTAAGLRCLLYNGASFAYAHDPNSTPLLLNPGTTDRYVTCLSKPRRRDGDARFLDASAAIPGALSSGWESLYAAFPERLDVAWYGLPIQPMNSSGPSGAIARIAIVRTDRCAGHAAELWLNEDPPPGVVILHAWIDPASNWGNDCPGFSTATQDQNTLFGTDWWVYIPAQPCPGDLNCDSISDIEDLILFLPFFGYYDSEIPEHSGTIDWNGDAWVDLNDLSLQLISMGTRC